MRFIFGEVIKRSFVVKSIFMSNRPPPLTTVQLLEGYNCLMRSINSRSEQLGFDVPSYFKLERELREYFSDEEYESIFEKKKYLPNINEPLQEALKSLSSLDSFAVGGSMKLNPRDSSCIIQINKPNDSEIDTDLPPLSQNIKVLKYEYLIPYCKVSPFGDLFLHKTIVDTNVRKAFECKPEDISFIFDKVVNNRNHNYNFDFLDEIVQEISSSVFKQPIDAIFYKLNVYPVGGHFATHVDTPTDPDLFLGSLVIALPSQHKGYYLLLLSIFLYLNHYYNSMNHSNYYSMCYIYRTYYLYIYIASANVI